MDTASRRVECSAGNLKSEREPMSGRLNPRTTGHGLRALLDAIRRCIEIVADILGRFDLTLADVARCTVYLADIADFPAMNAVFAAAFGATLPARSTPQVHMPFGARSALR
jgi:2-iminobutanoate/2-iminopropanoate deaminase